MQKFDVSSESPSCANIAEAKDEMVDERSDVFV